MNETGDARCEKRGSVSTLMPPSWASTVAWPIQVTAGCMAALADALALMKARSGVRVGVAEAGGRGKPSRAASMCHFSSAARPLGSNAR